jgi:hypothetical protein
MSQCGSQTWVTSHDSSQWAGFMWVTEHVTVLDHRSALSRTQLNWKRWGKTQIVATFLVAKLAINWGRGSIIAVVCTVCCKTSFVSDQRCCCVDSTAFLYTFWGLMVWIFKSCSWQLEDFPATCWCHPPTIHLVWILPVLLCGCETWWPMLRRNIS